MSDRYSNKSLGLEANLLPMCLFVRSESCEVLSRMTLTARYTSMPLNQNASASRNVTNCMPQMHVNMLRLPTFQDHSSSGGTSEWQHASAGVLTSRASPSSVSPKLDFFTTLTHVDCLLSLKSDLHNLFWDVG